MNMTGLSLDQAPPFWSINRFFVSAPIFGVLCGFYLLFFGNENIYNRYAGATIAFVHLFTLGFFAMVIFGASMQMAPVLAGVKTSKLSPAVSHLFLSIGAVLFFIGFYGANQNFKFLATLCLSISLIAYFLPFLYAIMRAKYKNFVIWGMIVSITCGFLAFLLGLHLLSSYVFNHISPLHLNFADIHASFAVFGFASLLIVAVAHQVLPMFYVTPSFPKFCNKFLFLEAFALLLYSVIKLNNFTYADEFLKIISAIVFSAFGAIGLKKISERRRKVSDASLKLWQIGLSFAIIWSVLVIIDIFFEINNKEYLFAVTFGFGFLGSIMIAMLNKITPFLVWFHLTSQGIFDAPNMNELLPAKRAILTMRLHIASLAFLLGGYFYTPLINIAGAVIAVEFLVLEFNLLKVSIFYNRLFV